MLSFFERYQVHKSFASLATGNAAWDQTDNKAYWKKLLVVGSCYQPRDAHGSVRDWTLKSPHLATHVGQFSEPTKSTLSPYAVKKQTPRHW